MGVVTTVSGTATGARAILPRPLPLRFRDEVFLQDQIRTAETSTVQALFADLMSDPQFTEAPVVAVMAGGLPGRVR